MDQQETILKQVDVYNQLDDVNKDIASAEEKLKQIVKILNDRKSDLRKPLNHELKSTPQETGRLDRASVERCEISGKNKRNKKT